MLRIKRPFFWYREKGAGPIFCTHIAWKLEIFWKALYNKSCLEWWCEQYAFFIFSINDPIRELRGRPLKTTFLNNSKRLRISEHLWNKNCLKFQDLFFLYQGKGPGPLNQGSKRVQSLFRISFYISIFWYKL